MTFDHPPDGYIFKLIELIIYGEILSIFMLLILSPLPSLPLQSPRRCFSESFSTLAGYPGIVKLLPSKLLE
jgi:hypothetical protein